VVITRLAFHLLLSPILCLQSLHSQCEHSVANKLVNISAKHYTSNKTCITVTFLKMIKTMHSSGGQYLPSPEFFFGGEGAEGRTRTNNKTEKNGKKVSQYILSN